MNWVDIGDIAAVAATVLRDPPPHHGRGYDIAAEAASITEIASLLGAVTGRPWRYESANPQVFYERMVAAGYDPVYMRCVRNYFGRTSKGSLVDPADVFGTIETVIGRPATSLRRFVETHRDSFGQQSVKPPQELMVVAEAAHGER